MAAAVVEFAGGPSAWVDRTFTAARGKGAFCNGKPISVSDKDTITQTLLVGPLQSPAELASVLYSHVLKGIHRLHKVIAGSMPYWLA